MNTIQEGSFLTLHYRLAGPDGADVVSTFGTTPATLSLGAGQLAPAIERLLLGLAEGDRGQFDLPAGEAFGMRNPDLVQRLRRGALRELGGPEADHRVGDVVRLPAPEGAPACAGVVRDAGNDWLLVDFNHPLAGQPVTFEVEVIGVIA